MIRFLSLVMVLALAGCAVNQQKTSVQTVDMKTFIGLRYLEIATLDFPESNALSQHKNIDQQVFTELDKQNFSDTLIQSLKHSGVIVLPSAQNKIHINITHLELIDSLKEEKSTLLTINADIAVSRNGVISRTHLKLSGSSKPNVGAAKDAGVKKLIQELGDLLREQSSFKR